MLHEKMRAIFKEGRYKELYNEVKKGEIICLSVIDGKDEFLILSYKDRLYVRLGGIHNGIEIPISISEDDFVKSCSYYKVAWFGGGKENEDLEGMPDCYKKDLKD
ncbi:hypothetical protein CCZ01_07875 [Helicobacter monodelphidis]|uniref:hypothetical protein n=1 Tax=Helicobacter sp. 15-1451 TaxID=2004995 RepID=UPI000DCCEDB7|nr:hypothetical protein [Helicobacter sp. 15-1451]RAX56962.1 hypothetical protein CCZ01_07875 [Helicobacter sp. 15-1451]